MLHAKEATLLTNQNANKNHFEQLADLEKRITEAARCGQASVDVDIFPSQRIADALIEAGYKIEVNYDQDSQEYQNTTISW